MRPFASTIASALLICAVLATISPAQEDKGTSVKSVQRLNRAPINKDVLQVKLPRPTETKLSNGLTVLLLERHKLPTVNVSLWIDAGSLYDPKDAPGLAKFTADMLREGTTHRTSAQLSSEIDELGATLTAQTQFGSTYTQIAASGLAGTAEKLLELTADILQNPAFAPEELEKYKKRELSELEQERSDPNFLAEEQMYRALYGNFPAAITSPTASSIQGLTAEQMRKFHGQYYLPGNALLGVVGDFDAKQMRELLEKHLGGWKGQPFTAPQIGTLAPAAPFKIYLVDRPDSVQTNILAGELTVPRNNPDYIPLRVMNRVLGEGSTGRLFLNLREEKGYTYGAYSFIAADTYPRPLLANTEVRTAVTDGSMHELLGEFKRIRDEVVPEAELDDAKRAMIASFALSLEHDRELIDLWMRVKHNDLPVDYWDRYPVDVAKVGADSVQRVAKKYLDASKMQVVCVGSGKEIKDVLMKYGPLEVYDVDGKRVSQ
jgi:predicted Zn-dependent peptidase